MPYTDISTGFTGFTVDVLNGSVSDSEGDVTRVLFAITFQERLNDVQFSITNGDDHWSALMPTDEYIGLKNPRVLQVNRDSAIVQFDMDEKYPSNSMATLCTRNNAADFSVNTLDRPRPFTPNTITAAIGSTVFNFGGDVNDEGEVNNIIFNLTFSNRRNEVEFHITDGDEDWAVLMPDGSYINLKNPFVLFQNRDGASISFQMEQLYPAGAPGLLVRRREEASWTIEEIDENHPFIPVQNAVFPEYVPVNEQVNLHSQVIVYPLNATLRGVEWSVINDGGTGAVVGDGWLTTKQPGRLTLGATIHNGSAIGTDFYQEIHVYVIENWIDIKEQPHLANALVCGDIKESISVIAETQFGELTYQWYKSPNGSNEGGTPIKDATSHIYKLPKGLLPGEYFYFCEIRKVNFPSVRTDVATVRVRDKLKSISIYPHAASIPPGSQQQFSIDRNPQTSDETFGINWYSSKPWVVSIDRNGLATAHNRGTATITADVDGVIDTVIVNAVFTPVTGILDTLPDVLETKKEYNLPNTVQPNNATKRDIIWEILSNGTTSSVIANGKLRAINPGNIVLRATVKGALGLNTDFVREYQKGVVKGHTPVADIGLNCVSVARVGEVIGMKGTIVPADATYNHIEWNIIEEGGTGATITNPNLLAAKNPGNLTIAARVKNGKGEGTDFVKTFSFKFNPKFIPVDHIENFPNEIPYSAGDEGYQLEAVAMPENAAHRDIIYIIDRDNETNQTSGIAPRIDNTGKLLFDAGAMEAGGDAKAIVVDIYVRDGRSDGVDFYTQSTIYVSARPADDVFVPVDHVNWKLPSVLRAYRPILIDKSTVNPFDARNKFLVWRIDREGDLEGAAALMFVHNEENHQDLVTNGVLFDQQFDWEFRGNTIYPMSAGKLKVKVEVPDGLGVNEDYVDERILDIQDPFIKVLRIGNMPSKVYAGYSYYLSPEIDTGDGVNEQTAIWDDRVSTYKDIRYELISGREIATLTADGILTPQRSGQVRVRLTVPNGLAEEYEWYGKTFEAVDAIFTYTINVERRPIPARNRIMTIQLSNHKTVGVYTKADFEKLRAIRPADSILTIGNTTFARKDVTAITFENSFSYTDLSNFGRNMTNLVKINKIPESARNLRNFLMGCSEFNQVLIIPKNVNGDRCLEGFLRDCVSYNQPITIPAVGGTKCLESFLRGCESFNRVIRLPSEIRGNYAMYSFMQGCTAFNSTIILPKKIHGIRCMENVLRDCVNFNKQITLPEDISGHYNFAAFMFNCNAFTSPVIVPTERFGEMVMNDVISLATFHRDSVLAQNGTAIYGAGAAKFQETLGNQGSADLVPLRTLNLNAEGEVPDPVEPEGDGYVGLNTIAETEKVLGYDDYVVDDPVDLVVNLLNNSEKLTLNNMRMNVALPEVLAFEGVETNKDLKLIKTLDDGSTVEETIAAPKPEHVHEFTGEYFFDNEGHWRQCSGCETISEKEAHVIGRRYTEAAAAGDENAPYIEYCLLCGYVTKHTEENAGNPECEHLNTERRNVVEATETEKGYSGDVYCTDCGRLIAVGIETPKLTKATESPENNGPVEAPDTQVEPGVTPDAPTEGGSEETPEVAPTVIGIEMLIDTLAVGESVDIHIKTKASVVGTGDITVTSTFDEDDKVENADLHTIIVPVAVLEEHVAPEENPENGGEEPNPTE